MIEDMTDESSLEVSPRAEKNHREHRGHRERGRRASLCALCALCDFALRVLHAERDDAPTMSSALARIAKDLARAVDSLSFAPPVTHVYNPLDYAWPAHAAYLERYGRG